MKAPKRTLSDQKAATNERDEITTLDSQAEHLLEQRLYERVLLSYGTYRDRRVRRMRTWRSAAIWIGTLILAGGAIWGSASLRSTATKEKVAMQLFSSTHSAKRISLPDSTVVILRPHSTLQVSADYNRTDRSVTLEGNAFFEVTKNKEKPFIVHSKHMETTVLGTRFSVNSPTNSGEHSVFLEEGKVSIQMDQEQRFLTPNERIVYHEENKKWEVTKLSDVSLSMETGALNLNGVDFATLRRCLADHYGISLQHQGEQSTQVRYKMTLKPQMPISDIAALIGTISARHTIINEQTITIK